LAVGSWHGKEQLAKSSWQEAIGSWQEVVGKEQLANHKSNYIEIKTVL
jgi:hypothetical protein